MSLTIAHYLDMMTQNDNDFFKELGHKIATLRKEQQITQVQLAEILGISQQYMQAFEAGRRKVPSSMLPTLAEVLAVSVEELIGIATTQNKKRGPAPKLLKQIEQISQLPKTKQKFVMDMLDTVIQQQT
ncbi:Predicted transcriptional regulator [hydrothermal vent metagenome]|uniref:Predicted transcriptional regulator n=1 Tax=hydrothermal vent metagenome TaxID=652676 RepID=A0A3B0X4V6_9ZZZZ